MEIKSLTERLPINIFLYFSHQKKEYDLKVIFRHAFSAACEMQDVPAHFSLIWNCARRRSICLEKIGKIHWVDFYYLLMIFHVGACGKRDPR